MNYHSDEWIMEKLNEHLEDAKKIYPYSRIVGIFAQGSMNYGLDYENSDVDTKLILAPALDEIIFNKKPVSRTHVRDNNEHIDAKDVRLYIDCFKKQNINFVEILFTKYKIINPMYEKYWKILEDNAEAIAHYDTVSAVRTMKGMASEKFHALEKPYPSKLEVLEKYGYDPKQLHHLYRLYYFLQDYIEGKPYGECLRPVESISTFLKNIKCGCLKHSEAKACANEIYDKIVELEINYKNSNEQIKNKDVENLFNTAQKNIVITSIKLEL